MVVYLVGSTVLLTWHCASFTTLETALDTAYLTGAADEAHTTCIGSSLKMSSLLS